MIIFGVQRRQKQKEMRLNGLKAIRRVTIHLILALLAWAAPALGHALHLRLVAYPFLPGWCFLECGLLYCYRLAPRNPHLCQAIIWSFSIPFTSILFLWTAACITAGSVSHPSVWLAELADRFAGFIIDPVGELRLLLAGLVFLGGLRIVNWVLESLFGIAGNPTGWPEVVMSFLRRYNLREPRQGPALWLYRLILLLAAKGFIGCSGVLTAYSAVGLFYPVFGYEMGQRLAMQFDLFVLASMLSGVGCVLLHLYCLMGSDRTVYFPELSEITALLGFHFRKRIIATMAGEGRWLVAIFKPIVTCLAHFSIRNRPDREDVWHRLTMPPIESTLPVRADPEAAENRFG